MNVEERLEQRRQNFMKPNSDTDRSNFAISLRKNKRQTLLETKRQKNKLIKDTKILQAPTKLPPIQQINLFLDSVTSQNELLHALTSIKSLCQDFDPGYFLESPETISRLQFFTHPSYSDEISSIVMYLWSKIFTHCTNICKDALKIITVHSILSAITVSKPETSSHAFLILGNIACDSKNLRLHVLHENIHVHSMPAILSCNSIKVLKKASFFFMNLSKEQGSLDIKKFDEIMNGLKYFLNQTDAEVLGNCLAGMSLLLQNGGDRKVQRLMHFGVVDRVVELAQHPIDSVLFRALKVIGDISYGEDYQIRILIEKGLFDILNMTAVSSKPAIRKESLYIISNVLASGNSMLSLILQHPLVDRLIYSASQDEKEILVELGFILKNISAVSTWEQLKVLLDFDLLVFTKRLLVTREVDILKNVLSFVETLLKYARDNKAFYFYDDFKNSGCLEVIEQHQKHMNPAIYTKVVNILNFFVSDEGEFEVDVEQPMPLVFDI